MGTPVVEAAVAAAVDDDGGGAAVAAVTAPWPLWPPGPVAAAAAAVWDIALDLLLDSIEGEERRGGARAFARARTGFCVWLLASERALKRKRWEFY